MTEKILIIDDDLDTLRLVGLMLQKQGYTSVSANSGAQGLEMVEAEKPDLIILDVMMPGMDGYEVARRLRADEKFRDIPILMFTAKGQLDDKVAGFEAGVDDYLTKPTHPTELHAHVKALLGRITKNKLNPPSRPTGDAAYLVGVISARGGLGVTTVASNLAANLGLKSGTDVILAEFRPGQGTLFTDLGLDHAGGLADLLQLHPTEISRTMIEEKLFKIHEGLKVLPALSRPKDAALLQNIQQFETILSRLEFMGKYVVVDLGPGLPILTQKIASRFKELIVVVEPYESSLHHSQSLLDDLAEIGVDKQRIFVAANYRNRSDTPQLSVTQMQALLSAPINVSFTPAPELHQQAARRHLVVSFTALESVTAVQFNSLATKIEARANKPPTV